MSINRLSNNWAQDPATSMALMQSKAMNSSKSTDHLSLARAPEDVGGEGKGLGSLDVKTDDMAKILGQ